jgi:hypothetical protein
MDDIENVARGILGFYGYDGGYSAGGFMTALITAWEKADSSNRARLSMAFPVVGLAVQAFSSGGAEALRALAGIEQEVGTK